MDQDVTSARTDFVGVRVTAPEKLAWRRAAEERGERSVSTWLRRLAEAAMRGGAGAGGLSAADRAAIAAATRQVRAVGLLLNQMVRRLNVVAKTGQPGPDGPPTDAQVRTLLTRLEEVETVLRQAALPAVARQRRRAS